MSVTDDDVIRRKLLIDGDGGNDDRRITTLIKMYIKWCGSTDTPEESNANYQRILATLAQCEHAMRKSVHVHRMNEAEQNRYRALNTEIEHNIRSAYDTIAQSKLELQKAKRVRRNRQEYDALAKVIQQNPDRQETLKQLELLDRELAELQSSKNSLEQKLELRKKQFHVLITAIHEMQRILQDDEDKERASDQMDTS